MLHLATKTHQLDFAQLMAVYVEGNAENGRELYPQLSPQEQILRAEQAFYQYLTECFFKTPQAVYAIWVENGEYLCALRLEPYCDGLLLEALETAPHARRQGWATKLIQAVQREFPQKIYSHVGKRNAASLAVHRKCGFLQVQDYARYIDGSVARNAYTLVFAPRERSFSAMEQSFS
jgi:GNAT superfamily N-acetyltransferase